MSVGERLYRLLLLAYPGTFREAYGGEMALLFRDLRRGTAGPGATLRFWAETVWDVARSAPALRLEALTGWWNRDLRAEEGWMRMTLSIAAIMVGALETANALQEARYGLLHDDVHPLLLGTVGMVAGALLAGAGIALLRRAPGSVALARGAAVTCVAVFGILGFAVPILSIFARLIGTAFPLLLLLLLRRGDGPAGRLDAEMA